MERFLIDAELVLIEGASFIGDEDEWLRNLSIDIIRRNLEPISSVTLRHSPVVNEIIEVGDKIYRVLHLLHSKSHRNKLFLLVEEI